MLAWFPVTMTVKPPTVRRSVEFLSLLQPVVVAPMAGGVSTAGLVIAAGRAGAVAFLAAGYKLVAAMRGEIDAVEREAAGPFGVNVFLPGAPAADPEALASYVGDLAGDAAALGTAAGQATWDDDDWPAKVADLVARPVPIVSFTFGCPEADLVRALREAGSSVWVTVTDAREAVLAAGAGADCLVVQGSQAGAHRGTFGNGAVSEIGTLDLIAAVRRVSSVPLVAAGGIMSADDVAAALAGGAAGVQCGTAFLRCEESGAHPAHKAALADPGFDRTELTRAFSGRLARGLVNDFMRAHRDAPAAYPEINNATRPLRAAAAAASDLHRMSLWAGEGYRLARTGPAAEVLDHLRGR